MTDVFGNERRIEEMTAEGQRVLAEAIELYKPAAVVGAFSGGDDSVVSTHFAHESCRGCPVFNADTLVGLGPSRRHIADAARKCSWDLELDRAGCEGPPKKMRVKVRGKGRLVPFDPAVLPAGRWADGAGAYEEYVLNWGFPGRGKPQHARMYQRLKERLFRRLLRRLGASKAGKKVLIVSGIYRTESAVRAGYKRAHAEGYFGDVWVNPFYGRTAADFAAYRDEFSLPRNPVKAACGISGECCCGTFGSGAERAAYRAVDPAFADYLDALEVRVRGNGFPWGWGESPPKWWKDQRKGQAFMFDDLWGQPSAFQPACVGCNTGRR